MPKESAPHSKSYNLQTHSNSLEGSGSLALPIDSNKNFGTEVVKFLTSQPGLSALPQEDLVLFASGCRFSSLDSGQSIITEGDPSAPSGFIVVSGCISMTKTSVSGKVLIVELLTAGDNFGLMLMLAGDSMPVQLSARAIRKSMVLWVPSSNFQRLLRKHPDQFRHFVSHLLLCLHSSYNLSRGLAHDRVEVRIASVLSSLALKNISYPNGKNGYTIQLTRQQLAELTGTSQETAIRITRSMQHQGILALERPGVIKVVNIRALQEMVD